MVNVIGREQHFCIVSSQESCQYNKITHMFIY